MAKQMSPGEPSADVATAATFPIRVGAVDIGSNALRFAAAEFSAPRRWEVLGAERLGVRLGHDVFLTGRLTDRAMDAAVEALAAFGARLDELGVVHRRVVATSAVRESGNGEAFVARVRDEAGLEIEVIGGPEEARLVYLAVAGAMPLGRECWLLADLGGGSVEVSLVDDAGIRWSESHTMGSVRLLEELAGAGEEPGRFAQMLAEYVATLRIPEAARSSRVAGLIATGGNIESLARLAGVDQCVGTLATLPLVTIRALIGTLARLSFRERVSQLGLREDRADVILPAAMVYERLATEAGVDEILVPGVGLREGVLFDLVDDLTMHGEHAARQHHELIQAALALGRKYQFDEAHGVQVAGLARSLFEQVREVLHLDAGDARIVEIAGLLHDIGSFISYKRHHKHSLYLLSQAELPGFTARDIAVVANVARYHRRGEPSPQHEPFASLAGGDQERVRRLAAVLRLADALDREHRQRVKGVRARVDASTLELRLTGDGDLLLERWAVQRKAQPFTDVSGLKVRIGAP